MASPRTIRLPRIWIDVAFGTNPLATPTWEDVTDYARLIPLIRRGRPSELDPIEAGRATVIFSNRDRRFEPLYASSPYYPNVISGRRLRIRAGENLLSNPSFETDLAGWTTNAPNTIARVTTEMWSGLAALKATRDTGTGDSNCAFFNKTLPSSQLYTVTARVKIPAAYDGTAVTLGVEGYAGGTVSVNADLSIRDVWQRVKLQFTPGSGDLVGAVTVRLTGATTGKFVYVDAVQVVTGDEQPYADRTYGLFHGFVEDWPPEWNGPKDGWVRVDCVDMFEPLANAALSTSYSAQGTGARVGAALDTIGFPAGERAIDAGISLVQASTLSQVDALSHLQLVEQTENGLFFQRGDDGYLTFHSRYRRIAAPYTTVQATFGDHANYSGAVLPYRKVGFAAPASRIRTHARITRVGGTAQEYEDAAAVLKHQRRSFIRDVLFQTDTDSADMAAWIVSKFKETQRVISGLELSPASDERLWQQVLSRELGDKIAVKRTPSGGAGAVTQDSHVEQLEHSITKEQTQSGHVWRWRSKYAVSPADGISNYLTLDDATLGVLDSNRAAF